DGPRRVDRGGGAGPQGGSSGGQPWQQQAEGTNGAPGERRRRRRRRRRRGGNGLALQAGAPGVNGATGAGDGGGDTEPVSFFQPAGPGQQGPMLGPDGQPIRKRRRRRRRGRGGRNRELRMQGGN